MAEKTYSETLRTVIAGEGLSRQEAHQCFAHIMDGAWSEAQIAALLAALAAKGESVDELAGAATAMRERASRIDAPGDDVVDTCGTGGTGLSTFNVSTAAALVAAGAGVRVAKHGNRTTTRASGSADVLAALGVNIDAAAEIVAQCLAEANVCFCFAVRRHPAMRHAAAVRKALGVRTIFNLLGPLTNPAGARRQVMGVFDADRTEQIAEVLAALGAVRAMVVHADDGLDELSTCSATKISELRDGRVRTWCLQPEDLGLPKQELRHLLAGSPKESAAIIRQVLAGQPGPHRDIVVLNAAAAVVVAERAADLGAGLALAKKSIDSGAAAAALEKLTSVSNR